MHRDAEPASARKSMDRVGACICVGNACLTWRTVNLSGGPSLIVVLLSSLCGFLRALFVFLSVCSSAAAALPETLHDPTTAGMMTYVENVDWDLGVKFSVTQPGALIGVQWFSGAGGPTAPQQWKLWNAATPAQPLYEFNNPAPLQSRVADFALTMPLHLPVGVYVLAYRLPAGATFSSRSTWDAFNPIRSQAAIKPIGGVRQSPSGTNMPPAADYRYFVSPKFVTGQAPTTGQARPGRTRPDQEGQRCV